MPPGGGFKKIKNFDTNTILLSNPQPIFTFQYCYNMSMAATLWQVQDPVLDGGENSGGVFLVFLPLD